MRVLITIIIMRLVYSLWQNHNVIIFNIEFAQGSLYNSYINNIMLSKTLVARRYESFSIFETVLFATLTRLTWVWWPTCSIEFLYPPDDVLAAILDIKHVWHTKVCPNDTLRSKIYEGRHLPGRICL